MKKLITGILATLSCLTFMAGCVTADPSTDTNTESPSATDTGSSSTPDANDPLAALNDAKDFLYGAMKEKDVATSKDYKILNYYETEDETYTVTVSVDVTSGVTVKAGETEWTVDIDSALEEDLAYKLTVEISDSQNQKVSFTLDRTAKANPIVPVAITAKPVEETAYKLYMYQVTKQADEYFNGGLDKTGYYLSTSTSHEYAKDVYVDYVEGSETDFNIYIKDGEAKKYIGVYNSFNSKGYHLTPTLNATINNFEHVTEADGWAASNTFFGGSYVFTWNETHGTFVTSIANAKYEEYDSAKKTPQPADVTAKTVTAFLGTSGTYYTFGGMSVEDEIENDDSCVGKLVEMIDKRTLNAEKKVTFEKNFLQKTFTFSGAVEETLPVASTFSDVTITWEVKDGPATITDGVLTVADPDDKVTVTLTATISCGADNTDTVDAVVTVYSKPVEISLADANELGVAQGTGKYTTKEYYVTGTVIEVVKNDYGNLYIADETGEIFYVYGVYDEKGNRYDKMGDNKPVVGDVVTFLTVIGNYKDSPQAQNATFVEKSTPAEMNAGAKVAKTIRELSVAKSITEAGAVTMPVAGTTYTDVQIAWASNNETAAAVNGATITYTLGSAAVDVTLTATVSLGSVSKPVNFTVNVASQNIPTLTLPEANTLGGQQESGKYTSEAYQVVGLIVKMTSTKYGTCLLIDENGNTLDCYGIDGDDGCNYQDITDATKKPVVGDVVKLLSVVGQYNGKPQLTDAKVVEITAATAAQKVAAEKYLLSVTTSYTSAAEVDLPATGSLFNDVAITWALTENQNATLTGNKLTIANADNTIALKATLAIGTEASATKEFTITVNPSTFTAVTTLEENTAYYCAAIYGDSTGYATSNWSSGFKSSTDMSDGLTIYVEKATNANEYYIYYKDGENKIYVSYSGSSTSLNKSQANTKPTDTWTIDTTNKIIRSTAVNSRVLAWAPKNSTPIFKGYAESNLTASTSDYAYAWFYVFV